MGKSIKPANELLPHLFRSEYAKMTAVLCRHFGLKNIETAEDIVGETFLAASEEWGINGAPENPAAWLYAVAKNKTKDYLRRADLFETKVKELIKKDLFEDIKEPDFSEQAISDSQLAMIFSVCNPINPVEAQISLALQVLCGFSVEEIANAFLTKKETVKKRLHRARVNLRNDNFQIRGLNNSEIQSRLETVLKTLYLLFNEGYYSKTSNQLVRKDLCSEAMRLTLILTLNSITSSRQTNALLALMCFQSSRLESRTNEKGEIILFEEQDRSLWDKELINKGNYYLVRACEGNEISKYHLEAGIAYWHTTPTGKDKWEHILHLYNQLILIEYSAVTALNRTFAFAKVYGNEKAVREAEKLNLVENNHYHELLGFLYEEIDINQSKSHYESAIRLTKSKIEKQNMIKRIERLNKL